LAALAVAQPGASQPPAAPGDLPLYYRPSRTCDFPVDVARIEERVQKQQAERPSELQLYYRTPNGRWQAGPRYAYNSLPVISEGRRGFRFTTPDDGEYEFTVQSIYPDGSASPREADMRPHQRVVIDTTPPAVQIRVNGKSVEWVVTDPYLLPNGVTLQCKWAKDQKREYGLDEGEWHVVESKSHGPFRPRDGFDWTGVLPAGQELWVRVSAKDQAGNEGFSPPVKVPGNGTYGTAFPRPGPDSPPGGNNNTGLPRTPQPRIEYVSSPDVTVDFTLRKVGRSGIAAFHLYVQTQKDPTGWQFVDRFPQVIPQGSPEQKVQLKYKAEKEGLYGFYVIAESGAGLKDDPPGKGDPPMLYVVVDWSKPFAKITGVQARKGGVRGPLVDITWQVADPNLMPGSISLEYSIDRDAKQWKKIAYGLDNDPGEANTGRYTWEVPDENLWRFWVRIRAVDKAANTGEHVWEKEVIVDLEKPSGMITGARGGNNPNPGPLPADPPMGPRPMNPMPPTMLPAGPSEPGPSLPAIPKDKQ
jgi:hypothetical protein